MHLLTTFLGHGLELFIFGEVESFDGGVKNLDFDTSLLEKLVSVFGLLDHLLFDSGSVLLLALWWLHTFGNVFAFLVDIAHHDSMLLGEDLEASSLVKKIFFWNVEYLLLNLHNLLSFLWILLTHHHGKSKVLHFDVD